MLYPVITQASDAGASCENERSSAGKATLTIERSSEAMNAPRAVTTNTALLRLISSCAPAGSALFSSIMKRTVGPSVALCNQQG